MAALKGCWFSLKKGGEGLRSIGLIVKCNYKNNKELWRTKLEKLRDRIRAEIHSQQIWPPHSKQPNVLAAPCGKAIKYLTGVT